MSRNRLLHTSIPTTCVPTSVLLLLLSSLSRRCYSTIQNVFPHRCCCYRRRRRRRCCCRCCCCCCCRHHHHNNTLSRSPVKLTICRRTAVPCEAGRLSFSVYDQCSGSGTGSTDRPQPIVTTHTGLDLPAAAAAAAAARLSRWLHRAGALSPPSGRPSRGSPPNTSSSSSSSSHYPHPSLVVRQLTASWDAASRTCVERTTLLIVLSKHAAPLSACLLRALYACIVVCDAVRSRGLDRHTSVSV